MKQYLDIIRNIISNGKPKVARTYQTVGLFDQQFNFDLSTGEFPLVTTRHISFRMMAAELWCFIHGVTSKKVFREHGCTIWDEWCNPQKVQIMPDNTPEEREAKKNAQLLEDDLGPIYGYQWRNFGLHYTGPTYGSPASQQSHDQFADVCDKLRKNPDDRRMVVSAWSYCQIPQMALPPCHVLFNLVHYDGTLHLKWHQRSCDMVLGVPYNIASYALLLILLARHANLKPGIVSGTLCDAHIYNGGAIDHTQGLIQQMTREPHQPPTYYFTSSNPDIFHWKPTDIELLNYKRHPAIKFPVAV